MPFVSRTRATFLSAEFGFLGVVVKTLRHTPRLKGELEKTGLFFRELKYRAKAGDLVLNILAFLAFFKSCLIVGIPRRKLKVLRLFSYRHFIWVT
jgi:hypothetical protein